MSDRREFYAKSIIFIFLLNTVIVSAPQAVGNVTGLDTGNYTSTNVADKKINDTTQLGDLSGITGTFDTIYSLYSSPNLENRVLQVIFLIYGVIVALDVVDLGWLG